MDRRVKERLVGASILVFLIVLIVPELLSGPAPGAKSPAATVNSPEPIRNVTVDLVAGKPQSPDGENLPAETAPPQGSSQTPAPSPTPQLEAAQASTSSAPSAVTAPVVTAPRVTPPSADAETPAPSRQASVETPPTSPTSVVRTAATPHGWAVQLGSFASRSNAEKLAHQVKSQGFPVYVSASGSGASARYRVRIGPLADRGSASQTLAKLKSLGHIGSLVSPTA